MSARSDRTIRAPAAAALRYRSSRGAAPQVVARGRGEVAERILALAREHDVPVHEDADLLELLATCDLGDEIPPELYAVVAELLLYLYRLNGKLAAEPGARAA
jgi:flagellar biosynthesis protein